MNEETYEALKNIIKFTKGELLELRNNDIVIVDNWIEEVAKEYDN